MVEDDFVAQPLGRTARHAAIVDALRRERIPSQALILQRLHAAGFNVTQATLSRDLDELGAAKVKPSSGPSYYAVPDAHESPIEQALGSHLKLQKMLDEVLTGIDFSYNTVVLKTPPGAAQYLASFIDRAALAEVAGCIAGDDTVFVLAREPVTGKELARLFETNRTSTP